MPQWSALATVRKNQMIILAGYSTTIKILFIYDFDVSSIILTPSFIGEQGDISWMCMAAVLVTQESEEGVKFVWAEV